MVATTTRRPNVDTLARWDAALKRANDKGLRLFQHDATGQWFCSGSDGQTVYAVTHYTCECQAALANDPVCQHRALYREACRVDDQGVEAMLKEVALPQWEPVAPHPDVPDGLNHSDDVRCRRCGYLYEVAEIDDWTDGRATCTACLTVNETGYTDAELDALIASATIPYDAALIGRVLDGEALTFDEVATMEGMTVLSIAAGSRTIETLPARTMCTDCLDTGTARTYTGGGLSDWVPVTCGCQRRAAE